MAPRDAPRPDDLHACPECGGAVARDQRYCLRCGHACSAEPARLLALAADSRAAGAGTTGAARAGAAGAAADAAAAAPTTASGPGTVRRGAIAVLMGIVGAGIVLGTMLGSNAAQTLASAVAPGITVTYPAGLGAVAQVAATPDTTADDTPADTTVEDTTVTEEAPLAEAPVAETPAPAAAPAPTTTTTETTPEEPTTPPVKHVWVVMLADQNLAKAAKDTQTAPYLAGTLAPQGTLLTGYHAVAHGSLPNSIALLSGQGPAPATQADCPVYADVTPADAGDDGQELGDGCLYSVQTGTIGDELRQSELGWKSYVESMGTACRHPKAGVKDPDHTASASSPYVTWRNPFVSFHTELDGDTCAAEDVDLAKLDADLAAGADAPAFSYVVPDRCHDGSAEPCRRGAPAGTAAADAWLKEIVPKILASKAYADDGLLVVTADQAPATGASADSSGCCRPGTYPNTKDAGAPGPSGAGGGVVGALLVSPYVAAGEQVDTAASHFTLLRSIEDVFKLQPLGYAALKSVGSLVPDVIQPTVQSAGDDTVTTRHARRRAPR